ncbi:MAG: UDP-glucose 4-epimerase [Parcubacteria group bacterium]|nr:UDP-glucose 4-epimerase [Parcubacteria group bacterium]
MKDKKIIIFGGNGYVGSHLRARFESQGAVVTIEGDVTNKAEVYSLIQGKDVIINCAAVVQVGGKFDPYLDLEVNLRGSLNILEARKESGSEAIHISIGSRAQYAKLEEKDLPVRETGPQAPISLYGIHKMTAEAYAHLYNRAYGLKTVSVRLPQVYGPHRENMRMTNPINFFIDEIMKNEKFYLNGFGKDLKDFIHIDDVVAAFEKLALLPYHHEVYNIGSGEGTTLKETADMIIEECGSGTYEERPFPAELEPFEMGSNYLDISKIKALGWKPEVSLRDGIKNVISSYGPRS